MGTDNLTSGGEKLSDRDVQTLWRRFKGYEDQTARDQLILNYAPTYGMDVVGFKVQDPEDLDELQARIEAAGLKPARPADRARPADDL